MYHEPQEELEVEEVCETWTPKDMENGCINEVSKKLNQLIKAHNALVKEVRTK